MSKRMFYLRGDVAFFGVRMAPRSNKLAAGMTATRARSRMALQRREDRLTMGFLAPGDDGAPTGEPNRDALVLATRGTLDPLAKAWAWAPNNVTTGAPCPCCGNDRPGVRRLTDAGRNRLRLARERVRQRRKLYRFVEMYGVGR